MWSARDHPDADQVLRFPAAQETARLVQDLQTIAHQAGHPYPLLIAVDQENGGVNSLFDEDYICQFPSAMGIAAAGNPELAYSIAKATATEVSACGVNLMLGPVLDVLTNARYQPLGVRATGDDPQEVSQYGIAAMNGFKDAGMATCGKHFPSYGNLDFLGSSLDIPIITQTLEELSISALVPFRNAIATGNLDAMFVGGCGITNPSMNVNHACLSDQVVDDLLRNELGFKGVAISECLEMEALSHEIGVKGGTVMAVEAGCDIVMLCRAYDVQLEAIAGLKLGYENEILTKERIFTSLRRVLRMKNGCTSWARALNPPGISLLSKMHPVHLALSRKTYDDSITVMRDAEKLIPLSKSLHMEEELLLLTPLVKPLPASTATKTLIESKNLKDGTPTVHDKWLHRDRGAIMSGEGVFRELGRSLARARHGKLLHTSYTANGVRPGTASPQERFYLISSRRAYWLTLGKSSRKPHQPRVLYRHCDCGREPESVPSGIHQARCHDVFHARATGQKKSLVVVAVSSPYDFAMDKSVGTYVCTFDFTETAMHALVRALCGEFSPHGTLPGTLRKSRKVVKSRQHWLVENYNRDRDGHGLDELLNAIARAAAPNLPYLNAATAASFELFNPSIEESHLVVRNSSTQSLYGFCATYFTKGVGIIGGIFVDPAKRNVSIGKSLHRRALRNLTQRRGVKKIQLGMTFPGVFPGIPVDENTNLKSWFSDCGWDVSFPRRLTNMVIHDLEHWGPPEGLARHIASASISFDLIHGLDNAESVLNHVATHASPEVFELYRTALQETKACGVVRAKSSVDSLLGTVIICSPGSHLATFVPSLQPCGDELVGGIVAPLVPSTAQATTVLQGLALMGVRQNKAHKSARSVLSWVQDESYEPLLAMGFEVLQVFEELANSPDNVSTYYREPPTLKTVLSC